MQNSDFAEIQREIKSEKLKFAWKGCKNHWKGIKSNKKVQEQLLKYKILVLSLKYTNTFLYFTYLGFSCIYRIKFNAFKISIISKFNFINNCADNLTKADSVVESQPIIVLDKI